MEQASAGQTAVRALEEAVSGMAAGTRLPSYRALQERYRLSPTTVQRAVQTLVARGVIVTRPGDGTYVAESGQGHPTARTADRSWQALPLGSRPGMDRGLERILAPTSPGAVPLVSTFLDESLQPLGLLARAAARAARTPGLWGRPPVEGLPELRAVFARELGAGITADQVLVTPGGQAALSAAMRNLGHPGDPIVVESPTYGGALAAARAAGLVPVPVPTDADGVLPDALDDVLRDTRAKLVYLQTRHANPTGAVLARDRREPVLEAVRRARAFMIEDDWVRDLDLDRPSPPPLASDDEEGHVIYIRSLTKSVAAGLRIAGVVARGPVADRLRLGRIHDDLFVPPVLQAVAWEVLTAPGWPRHLSGLRRQLKERRDAMAAALLASELAVPAVPAGGVHIWARLPEGLDERKVVAAALAAGVEVGPGRHYFVAEAPHAYLRLSYAAVDVAAISPAIRALSDSLATLRP